MHGCTVLHVTESPASISMAKPHAWNAEMPTSSRNFDFLIVRHQPVWCVVRAAPVVTALFSVTKRVMTTPPSPDRFTRQSTLYLCSELRPSLSEPVSGFASCHRISAVALRPHQLGPSASELVSRDIIYLSGFVRKVSEIDLSPMVECMISFAGLEQFARDFREVLFRRRVE